jgi:hypothetical protein
MGKILEEFRLVQKFNDLILSMNSINNEML